MNLAVSFADNQPSVPQDFDFNKLYRLLLPQDSRSHGFILPEVVSQIPWTSDFRIDHEQKTIQLENDDKSDDSYSATCNKAFQATVDALITQDVFSSIHHGRHSEPYKIIGAKYPVQMERFTSSLFGIASRGAHMTGYTKTPEGEMKIWIPRRAPHLFTYPNKLDTTVAGGVKASHTPFQCIVEESDEEASLPRSYVSENTKSVGVITYLTQTARKGGLVHPDVLYVFDLEMPSDMIPKPNDDEVAEFVLMSVDEVKEAMRKDEFKANCNLVMIDFFLRHGIMTPENEKDYIEICQRLHRKLLVPTGP
jgi:isopentenyldiphosphate isomerase